MPTNLHTSYVEEITNPQAYTKFKKKDHTPRSPSTHVHIKKYHQRYKIFHKFFYNLLR